MFKLKSKVKIFVTLAALMTLWLGMPVSSYSAPDRSACIWYTNMGANMIIHSLAGSMVANEISGSNHYKDDSLINYYGAAAGAGTSIATTFLHAFVIDYLSKAKNKDLMGSSEIFLYKLAILGRLALGVWNSIGHGASLFFCH